VFFTNLGNLSCLTSTFISFKTLLIKFETFKRLYSYFGFYFIKTYKIIVTL